MNNKSTDNHKNKTTYNRSRSSKTHYKKSFALDIFRNKQLKFDDIGLLTWLLSNNKSYVLYKDKVMERSGLPQKKFLDSWKKLEKFGYIEKERFKRGVHWVINEIPVTSKAMTE